jgi:hypothetical protein
MSLQSLQSQVQISNTCAGPDTPPTEGRIVEISAQATAAAQPGRAASAVAHSYGAYAGGHNSVG